MNILVVYSSKTGFTKRYAQWIKEVVPCTCVEAKEAEKLEVGNYDVILYGGGFYAGKIHGVEWLKSRLPKLEGKRTAVFATGATPPEAPEVEKAIAQNFTEEELGKISCFYLRSGINYENMDWKSRMMMKVFAKMMEKKKDKTEQEKDMASHLGSSFDAADRKYLEPLIRWVQER